MNNNVSTEQEKQVFDPLYIMGIFWSVFGIIVLIATIFIEETSRVPLLPSLVTNILAGGSLLAAGVVCLVKARAKNRKNRKEKGNEIINGEMA